MRTCAIFGTGEGVGSALARRFGREGWRVALVARSEERLNALADALAAEGIEASPFAADLSDLSGIPSLVREIDGWGGGLDLVLYNAVGFRPGAGIRERAARLEEDLRVSVVAPQAVFLAALPALERAGGAILVTGGGAAFGPIPDYFSLCVTKAALRNQVLTWHEGLKGSGVFAGTVTVAGNIAPGGPFDPDLIAGAFSRLHAARTDPEIVFDGQ